MHALKCTVVVTLPALLWTAGMPLAEVSVQRDIQGTTAIEALKQAVSP